MKYFTRTNCTCSSTYSFNYFCITLYLNPKYSIKCSESWVESLQILLLLLLYFLLWQSHICLTNNFSVVCKKLLLFYIWPPAKIQLIFLEMHNDSGFNPHFHFYRSYFTSKCHMISTFSSSNKGKMYFREKFVWKPYRNLVAS